MQHAKVFFLTCDLKLAKFNFEEFGHKANGTISEVIPDFLLADCLWLQNPQSSLEMPLKLLISAHSQHLFVERNVWQRFMTVLRELKDSSSISDEKIATLLYYGHVEELLRDFDDSQCDVITREFVMAQIEKSAVEIDIKIIKQLKEKETEVKRLFEEKFSEQEKTKSQEWISRIIEIKKNLRKSATRKASFFAFFISAFCTIVILGVIVVLISLGLKKYGKDQALPFLTIVVLGVSVVLGGAGIIGVWRDLYKFFKSSLSERFYLKRLKEAGLETSN
jgi:hypothetical protein